MAHHTGLPLALDLQAISSRLPIYGSDVVNTPRPAMKSTATRTFIRSLTFIPGAGLPQEPGFGAVGEVALHTAAVQL